MKLLLKSFVFSFFAVLFLFFIQIAYAVQCTCDPGGACGNYEVLNSYLANYDNSIDVTYSYCSNDCRSCSTYGWGKRQGAGHGCWDTLSGITDGFRNGENSLQSTCPAGYTCNPANVGNPNTCPANYSLTGLTVGGQGLYSERYTWKCCAYSPGNPGGPGGPGCTQDRSFPQCDSDPNFGACGYMVTQYGGPVVHLVTHNTCTGWACHPETVTSCQSTLGGSVFIDTNKNGTKDNGEINANTATQTSLQIDGGGTTYVVSTDVNGNYTLGNLNGGNYTITVLTPPTNYLVSTNQQTTAIGVNNRNPRGLNLGIYPNTFNVSGHVYIDTNENGVWDVGELAATSAAGSVTISDGAGQTGTMQADGSYTLANVLNGATYTISITAAPTGYKLSGSIQKAVNGADVTGADLGVIPLYGISGVVFTDTYKDFSNGNACYEQGADTLYTASPATITISQNGNVVKTITNSTGSFNADTNGKHTLSAGTYTVGFTTTLPDGYQIKTPAAYNVTIGQSCDTGTPMAYCNQITSLPAPSVPLQPSCDGSGNVRNISFGLNNANPFFQVFCQDFSSDKGITDPLPAVGTTCGGVPSGYLSYTQAACNIPGIVFYNGTVNFGLGQANPNNVLVNRTYTPLNPEVNQMAYSFIETTLKQRGITPIDLSGTDPQTLQPYCGTTGDAGLADCKLENDLPSGVYQIGATDPNDPVNSLPKDLEITASPNFNADTANPKAYIFLVSGNIKIDKEILIPNGASAAFIAQGGITIDDSVGEQDATSMTPNLEGIYVAGSDFTVNTKGATGAICNANGTNLDLKLNIVGYIIPGAEGSGGTIINMRDLCSLDTSCPVQTTGIGDSGIGNTYLLNLSNVLKLRTSFQQETAPGGN